MSTGKNVYEMGHYYIGSRYCNLKNNYRVKYRKLLLFVRLGINETFEVGNICTLKEEIIVVYNRTSVYGV